MKPRQRLRVALLMVSLLAAVTAVLFAYILQNVPSGGPRLAGDLVVAAGEIPGDPSTSRQRISCEASFTNTGSAPIHGWTWEVVIPPALQTRLIREEYRANPDPGSAPRSLHGWEDQFRHAVPYVGYVTRTPLCQQRTLCCSRYYRLANAIQS